MGWRENTAALVHEESNSPSLLAAPLAILAALLGCFGLIALLMVHDHAWTDSLAASFPLPGAATLAADPSLTPQMRMTAAHAWNTLLGDQTPALIAEAEVANDALVPVKRIVMRAEARVEGRTKAVATAVCGKQVSSRLLGRMGRDEVETLLRLDAPTSLQPGQRIACQIAFPGVGPGVQEVVLRVASVEPSPGHRSRVFHPQE